MNKPVLKRQTGINVSALAETFDNTTSSYKYLWFLSLLDILKERGYKTDKPVTYHEIFNQMLKNADPLCQKFRLFLGASDRICSFVTKIRKTVGEKTLLDDFNPEMDNRAFREASRELSKYVPHLWLRPFVNESIKRRRGNTRTRIVRSAKAESKGGNPPPYYIHLENGGRVFIHPLWAKYFKENEEIVRGWCLWHFTDYLQKRNPNVPNIINKVTVRSDNSRQLDKQRKFWIEVIKYEGGIHCIYSKDLIKGGFELDHYVPWSFVAHNNLWNLIPATREANNQKSNRLPSNDDYINRLVRAHCRAMEIRAEYFPRRWKNLVESYKADLRLSTADLTKSRKMHRAYKQFVPSLMEIAEGIGFKSNWTYKKPEGPPLLKNQQSSKR